MNVTAGSYLQSIVMVRQARAVLEGEVPESSGSTYLVAWYAKVKDGLEIRPGGASA